MGRKSKYESHVLPYLEDIKKWYLTESEGQIAKRLGISPDTFCDYKAAHAELAEALRHGRENLIAELKDTLRKKAQGFTYKETKRVIRKDGEREQKYVEEYERYALPDTGAIHLLLKNLDPEWRNDDAATMELKRSKAELEKQKAEVENW